MRQIAGALADAINALTDPVTFDVRAFASPQSGRLTLVDPTADLFGQFGRVGVSVTFGNGNRSDFRIPLPSIAIT